VGLKERELGGEGIRTFQDSEVLLYYSEDYWISEHLTEQNTVFQNLHLFLHSGEKLEAHTQLGPLETARLNHGLEYTQRIGVTLSLLL
jgi:hypothetical protein